MERDDPVDHFGGDSFHLDDKPSAKKKNTRVIEMRKERSRNAARNRRGKENAQFDELAKLLPLPAAITSQLDKASIIRLTISYLSMREFSGRAPKKMNLQLTDGSEGTPSPSETSSDSPSSPQISASREVVPYDGASTSSGFPPELLSETGSQLLQALEGFLMVLSIEGKILYVSETVSVNLGLSQVELTGNSVFNYIHQEDHPDILEQLSSGSSVDTTQDNQFQDSQKFFPCQGRGDSLFNQGEEISPPKIFPHQPRSFFVRMKCTLVRRGGSYAKSAGFKVVHCVGRIKEYASDKNEIRRRAFVLLAQPVPTMNINELPLECNMFVSRVNMDLKIVYCEGRIHRFMDYLAKDVVGISAYDFYHAGDVALIQAHHAKFLSKGQVWTKYYRWMNKNGGWVWMQSKASLIPHPSNPALKQMLCLNYILSDVEHRSVVLGMAQLDNKPELTSAPANILTEVPCDGDSSGELSDAFIDDQVMVFPKWQATSDKLVPQQTLLDQMVLQRTGYTQQFNEVFNNWSDEHPLVDRKNSQSDNESHDQDFDEKELQDIADIINADITPFDQSLMDFVVSGSTPSLVDVPSSQLGPIGGYIEEIPTSYVSTTSVAPKVEKSSVVNDYGHIALCSQRSKRPFTASSFSCDGSNADTNSPKKAPRLSHLEARTKTASQHQGNKLTLKSITCQLPAPCTEARHTGALTSTSSSNNRRCQQDSNVDSVQTIDTTRNKVGTLANRKPKTLLEQLVMMPGSGKDDDDLFNDDLMLELVEELLENNVDVDMIDNSMSSIPSSMVGGNMRSTSSPLVPLQHIKQEGVSSSSTTPPAKLSECLQNFLKSPMNQQQFGVLHQSSGSGACQTDSGMQQRNVTMQDDVATSQNHSSFRPSLPQQQRELPQRLLHARQKQQQSTLPHTFQVESTNESLSQQQQQNSLSQQFQMSRTKQLLSQQQQQVQQQEEQQKQHIRSSYNGPHQRQAQQQRTPELQSIAEQSQIFRELNELIKRNNNMQQSNQNLNQRVMISSSPLPELSNVIDEELDQLPINNQANSFNTQSFNSNVAGNRNYTGMM